MVIGLAAAWFATQAGLALARSDRPSLTTKLALTALAMLLVFRNLTADVPHPDNLHMLHLALTLYLAYRAQRHFDDAEQARGMRWAVAAMVLAALGILAKQTAAGTAIGLWGAWLWTGSLSRGRLVKLAAIAIAIAGLSAAWLLVPTWSRFHCFELLAAHPVEVRARLQQLLIDLHVHSHFAGPPILALAAVLVNRRLR